MSSLVLRYDNIQIELASDSAPFIEFASSYLSAFHKLSWNTISTPQQLKAELLFEGSFTDKILATNWQIGRDTWASDTFFSHQTARYFSTVAFDGEREMSVRIGVKPLSTRQWLQRLLRRTSLNHDHQFFLRRIFHFPLFTFLNMRGFSVGHGTALKLGKKVIVLVGIGGAGKSTLSTAIQLHCPEATFITDNYVVLSNNEILPFPEPLRMHKDVFTHKTIIRRFDPIMRVKERDYFLARNVLTRPQSVEQYIFLVIGRGDELDIAPMPAEQAWHIFHSTTLMLGGEFPHADYPAFMPYLRGMNVGRSNKRCCEKPTRGFKIVIPKFNSEKQIATIVRQVIDYVL